MLEQDATCDMRLEQSDICRDFRSLTPPFGAAWELASEALTCEDRETSQHDRDEQSRPPAGSSNLKTECLFRPPDPGRYRAVVEVEIRRSKAERLGSGHRLKHFQGALAVPS